MAARVHRHTAGTRLVEEPGERQSRNSRILAWVHDSVQSGPRRLGIGTAAKGFPFATVWIRQVPLEMKSRRNEPDVPMTACETVRKPPALWLVGGGDGPH